MKYTLETYSTLKCDQEYFPAKLANCSGYNSSTVFKQNLGNGRFSINEKIPQKRKHQTLASRMARAGGGKAVCKDRVVILSRSTSGPDNSNYSFFLEF
jgi:hypothetical protein